MNLLWQCDKRFTKFRCSRRLHNVSESSSWVLAAWYSAIAGAASLARVSGEAANARSHLGSSSSSAKIIEAILFEGNAYAFCLLADKVFNSLPRKWLIWCPEIPIECCGWESKCLIKVCQPSSGMSWTVEQEARTFKEGKPVTKPWTINWEITNNELKINKSL